MAQLWATTTLLLKCPPIEFAKFSFIDQILKVQDVLQKPRKLRVYLYVNKFEVKIQ